MKTLALVNHKGGVGKTTSAAERSGTHMENIGSRVIRINEFILEEENGAPRAALLTRRTAISASKDGPWLVLSDETGKLRAGLGVYKDGPALHLTDDETDKLRAWLAVGKDGSGLHWTDETDKLRAALSAVKGRATRRDLYYEENGITRAALSEDKDGWMLSLYDEKGNLRAVLLVGKDEPRLGLYDEKGNLRTALNVDKDGPRLVLSYEKGKPRAALSVVKDGRMLDLYDENGELRGGLVV
jgi:hypothetical protein